ncbi:hypothetical protein [Paracoccus sp. (in: a-proteobacteria)]|uniref:hypothetical protein n=1 Tax=Paracoccus sp. TaxID=267 RepID=UPI00289B4A55|nr:hypothetical protein [Paracoccus sp. (in: a-proteobacteria)]
MARVFKRMMIIGLVMAIGAYMASSIMSFSDNIGFSSNHDFYFRVRHPIRALILDYAVWLGLVIALGSGIAWAWLMRQEGSDSR